MFIITTTIILSKRITEWAEDHALLTEAQFGFRPTYSTTDANYTLYSLVNSIRKKQKLYCAFIDFSTAFDSVDRDILHDCLTESGISSKMLKILIALYSNTSSCVKLNNVCSDICLLYRGLRHGDSLSPVLFIFYINNLAGRLSKKDSSKSINILQYADDLAIFAEGEELLQTKLDMLQIYCKEKKLCVNISKSKIVVFHANKSQTSLMYNNYVLEEVDCFNYLGLTWHRKRNMHYAQQIIVKQATRAKAVLDAHLRKHKNMPVDMIFLLFDTLVRPILLFNCEIWGIKISNELELFHLIFF